MKYEIKELLSKFKDLEGKQVVLNGWIRNNRGQKEFGFIDLNDGTAFKSIQAVYESNLNNFKDIQKYRVGSSIEITGILVLTPNAKQPFEVKVTDAILLGDSPEDYPIQPKRHSKEFLREVAHLRPRTNLFNAVYRVRSLLAHAVHSFFQEKGFIYTHTPILTASDGEGAGEMFKVTTLDLNDVPKDDKGDIDFSKDFFGKNVNLTVTGQLEAEAFALAFKKVYTFGPTFRAENSNTKTHASEFWMIEPEIAFADLNDDMKLAEDMIKYIVEFILEKAPDEIEFFDKFVQKGKKQQLLDLLNSTMNKCTHKEAVDILLKSGEKFDNLPAYDADLATEHEKYLTNKHFNGPVFIIDWPKEFKAFYMRLNDDGKTVAAMDLLVPGAGELIGGSQREERLDLLIKRMEELSVPKHDLEWYLDLRKYGGVKHAGFGMGFERLVMYITGIDNIRDASLFARTPRNCEF